MMAAWAVLAAVPCELVNQVNRKMRTEPSGRSDAEERRIPCVPIVRADGKPVRPNRSVRPPLREVIREFCGRWTPGAELVYVEGGSEGTSCLFKKVFGRLERSAVTRRRLPDIVVYIKETNCVFLIEAAACNLPINEERREELLKMFENLSAGLVFVTAFASRKAMAEHFSEIAWGTEAWLADSPDHLIHFNGGELSGPYAQARVDRAKPRRTQRAYRRHHSGLRPTLRAGK